MINYLTKDDIHKIGDGEVETKKSVDVEPGEIKTKKLVDVEPPPMSSR